MRLTIHTRDLLKSYHNRIVVNHVSVNVKQGEIVGLLGPNGAGKTTTFYMVVGLIKPDEGDVFLDEVNITKLPMYKRAQMGIGYLPQEASVFRKLSVEDNIKAILEMTNLTKKEQKEKLESLLEEFGLNHVRRNNGDSLSGGERRRTEIARALSVNPKFILLDEPFAGVDPIAVEDIQTVVARLKYKNIGILITDHNVNETLSICDRAYLLIEGKIFKHGTAEELAANEQVRRLYLGRNFELKRKDYLHEEAKKEATLENIILSFENAIDGMEKIETENVERERLAMPLGRGETTASFNTAEELGLPEYSRFLLDTKNALIQYAEKNNKKEILERAKELGAEDRDLKSDLNMLLVLLKAEQG
ncbi:MAG TPA: LPS export ABC transporter ATP-binding protein [Puia sp.]|nr:LPS export ABC transporter ATP-binding protein [Puia sp.]